jgi:F-type H+-transporting ATPase subunit gamma
MAQTREIKRRIASVQNTQQITRAMKMVAAAKLRRAQQAMEAMRPYDDHLAGLLAKVERDLFGDEHPLFRVRSTERAAATIVIAGDKGLCGGFNSNLIRYARGRHFDELSEVEHRVYSIGKRATSALKKTDLELVHTYSDVFDNLSYILANQICEELVSDYLAGTIDAAYVVYNSFVTVMTQKPVTVKLLPLDLEEWRAENREDAGEEEDPEADEAARAYYELEPDPAVVMEKLIGRLIATRLFRALLESYAAELGARMTAMDSATTNAEEMIEKLTMDYNRARQTGITAELLDIVGGAEGLKG